MIKFYDLPVYKQAVRVYLLSIIVSIIFNPLSEKLYVWFFRPVNMDGGGLFMVYPSWFEKLFGLTIFSLYFFLPFFIFMFLKSKQWQVYIIGIIFPFLFALVGGTKHFFWAIVLSAVGWGLAQAILFFKKKRTH